MANFLHDSADVSDIVSKMKSSIEEYANTISSLESVVNEMANSSDWQDDKVKTSFVNTAKSYIEAFKMYRTGMEAYISVLNLKSGDFASLESTFSK